MSLGADTGGIAEIGPFDDLGSGADIGSDPDIDAGIDLGADLDMGAGADVDTGANLDMGTDMGTGVDMGTPVLTGAFGTPVLLADLDGPDDELDPSLTSDELVIMLMSSGLRMATRSHLSATWGPLTTIPEFSSLSITDPDISADGLHVYLTVEDGSLEQEIYESSRASRSSPWSTPVRVVELSSSTEDCCTSTNANRTRMFFSSIRNGGGYGLFEASRSSVTEAWSNIVELSSINSGNNDINPALARSGLEIYFDSTRTGNRDLYIARRASLGLPFAAPELLDELNSSADERDPWVSPDGSRIYFSSNRDGSPRIYFAERTE